MPVKIDPRIKVGDHKHTGTIMLYIMSLMRGISTKILIPISGGEIQTIPNLKKRLTRMQFCKRGVAHHQRMILSSLVMELWIKLKAY